VGSAEKKRKKEDKENEYPTQIVKKKTRASLNLSLDDTSCIFCQRKNDECSHRLTSETQNSIFEDSIQSQMWDLHARLTTAPENVQFFYHLSCYAKMKRAAKTRNPEKKPEEASNEPLVMAQLIAFTKHHDNPLPLSFLKELYEEKVKLSEQEGAAAIHSTRFRDQILKRLGPEWTAHKDGNKTIIAREKSVGDALFQSWLSDSEAENIVSVGVLLRKYVLQSQPCFTGSFCDRPLSNIVPAPLLTLVDVLLEGPDAIKKNDQSNETSKLKIASLISQLIVSNSSKSSGALVQRNAKDRETPFPLYVGLKLHITDRMKDTIIIFHHLGLSVSYPRVMEVRQLFAEALMERWSADGVVVPTSVKKNVFVTGAVDNIDVSGKCELHGTAISMTSHSTTESPGEDFPPLVLSKSKSTRVHLPKDYAQIPCVEEFSSDIFVPAPAHQNLRLRLQRENQEFCYSEEDKWLDHVGGFIGSDVEDLPAIPITYAGYFSHLQNDEDVRLCSSVGVFPILD
jgi:hypothetical protein